jgi:4-hydroxybenzoate polyprenyltransferase
MWTIYLTKLLKYAAASQLIVALAATSLAASTTIPFYNTIAIPYIIAFVFVATFSEYNLHKALKIRNSASNYSTPESTNLSLKQHLVNGIISGVAGIVLFMFLNQQAIGLCILCLLITALYSSRFLSKFTILRNVKLFPGIKTIVVTTVWTIVTTLLPVYGSGIAAPNSISLILLFSERFLFILSIAIIFDIRDIQIDTQTNRNTIPVKTGVARASAIAKGSLVLYFLFAFLEFILNQQIEVLAANLIAGAALFGLLTLRKLQRNTLLYSMLLDGSLLLKGLLALLTFFVFSS